MSDELINSENKVEDLNQQAPPTEKVALAKEEVEFSKQTVLGEKVSVTRTTSRQQHVIDELLTQEQVEIQHVAIGEKVTTMPPIREENDLVIIPIVEEKIEVIRTLILKEEIHIKKVRKDERFHQVVELRSQQAVINRNKDDH